VADRSDYSLLCRDRDLAAYGIVGATIMAVGFLNLNEVSKAHNVLLGALDEFQTADRAITEFHKTQFRKGEQHGNRSARATAA
jgi:hypothetical protein